MFLSHPCRCVCWVETRPQPWQLSLCWEGLTRTLQYKDNSQQQSDTYPAIQRQQSTWHVSAIQKQQSTAVRHVPCNTKTTDNSSLTCTLQYKKNSQQQSDMYPAIQSQQSTVGLTRTLQYKHNIEQIWGNVLTYMTKHKEQWSTNTFDRKLCLSGIRRLIIIKEEGSKEEDRQGVDVKKMLTMYT